MDVTVPTGCSRTDIFFEKHKNMEIRLKSNFILKSFKPIIGVYGISCIYKLVVYTS
jgi:hypothetical protein